SAEPCPEQKRQFRFLELIGRLRPGVDVAQAQAALGTVQERLKGQYAESYGGEPKSWGVRLAPLEERGVGGARPGLLVLLGAVLLVLLIACRNAANPLLARAAPRGRELARRHALCATRPTIVKQ